MTATMLPRLALQIAILLVLNEICGLAAPPYVPEPPEAIAAPPPQAPLPPRPLPGDAQPDQIFTSPVLSENSQPPPIPPAQPARSDQPLPINLATALGLSNARPLVIAFAQASVEEAAARLQGAQVLWLPDINAGTEYYRHSGTDQSTDGTVILDNKHSFFAGGGVTLNFGITDAIFRPLPDRRELAARESDLQAAQNDALLSVALAYFDVQQARGTLAGTLDAAARADALVRKTAGLAKGLVAEIEVDRARDLAFDLRQQIAAARANWRVTSARLTRVLRLNPAAVVVPLEPPHLQVSLIAPGFKVADLLPVGLANRPELAAQRALVQASYERVRQERFRPFLPSVVVGGENGPGGAFNGGLFGGGTDSGPQLYGGRFDVDVGVVWTLDNLGAGNRSLVRQRIAQEQRAAIDFANVQDQVAQEVVQAHAQMEATAAEVDYAMTVVKEAVITYNGTLRGLDPHQVGDLLQLVSRPQEAVAALEQLNRAYGIYFAAVNGYNRAQFQLYQALGFPARILVCDHPVGKVQSLDTSRPPGMAPVGPFIRSCPCP